MATSSHLTARPAENGKCDVSEMRNGPPSLTHPTLGVITPENMLQQMNELILENNELKEAMKQHNQAMKGCYEELSVWREKQMEERELFESKFREAQQRLCEMSGENEHLKRDLQDLKEKGEEAGQGSGDSAASPRKETHEELEHLKAQVVRLQAEKADLLTIISELQLKVNLGSSEDSFVEIRMAEGEETSTSTASKDNAGQSELVSYVKSTGETKKYLESEEMTVSRLLQSLREESARAEMLERDLSSTRHRLAEAEQKAATVSEQGTQTEEEEREDSTVADFVSEVESLKLQIKSLCKELQEAHLKLNDAELLKKRLQDKCQSLDQKLSENEIDQEEKQELKYTVKKLELQVESMREEIKLEQSKTESEASEVTRLQDAFDKLSAEHTEAWKIAEELRKEESERMKMVTNELSDKLERAERALAAKQLEIDDLKVACTSQQEDMETVNLLRTQMDIYCSDFHAEREAREKIHGEKEQLAVQLEFMIQENSRLKQELEMELRESIVAMQSRHGPTGPREQDHPRLFQRGAESVEQQLAIPKHSCPKCGKIMPDLDTLQIHVLDCIT
uniref:Optineurin n=1 Tax=Geotrypetes seraphini TaxID=260995 RepID=A0A6P8S9K2_GEOSA|nr:optineurin [Geotrypetes seraphini]XP_033814914.1 optineurin [Geotrypetes seraphini]XP_033814915.1 optineurin [Geotrypetes seraphini]